MKLPLSWLNEYVDVHDVAPQELADKLVSIGFEVEEIISPRTDITGVVVGRVVDIVRHENSDKLWICRIDIGTNLIQIVTGAQNVKKGDLVPVATVGATLPGGKKIAQAALRGVDSFGMLCSGGELCVDDDVIDGANVDGILILPKNSTVGENIMHTLGIDDTVLDVSITANRPDCQAVVNLAREISVLLDRKFKLPDLKYKTVGHTELPPVKIADKSLCSRYIGRVIRNVKIEKSPKWMRDRLRMCGIRPINNLVDITNYVLLEMGQPLHAFDKKMIDKNVCVRKGVAGESITALDGKQYDVDGTLIIADASKPLAIAGIMGGEFTSIFPDTKDVFLEAARFERSNIRRSSRKIGLRSDSSARFEKGVDWMSVELGSERALALIDKLGCGDIVDGVTQDCIEKPKEKVIATSKKEICSLLGIDIEQKTIISILKKQGISVQTDGKVLVCTIPLIREDIDAYPDLAEDIMRFYGYDNIVSTYSENTHQTRGYRNIHDENIQRIRDELKALGIDETLNYSFVSPDVSDKLLLSPDDKLRNTIPLKNPLNREISVMRTQLISSMLNSMSRNCARKNGSLRFYELDKVYDGKLPLEELPSERDTLCIGFYDSGDFYDIKFAVGQVAGLFGKFEYSKSYVPYLHPNQSLHISGNGLYGDFGKLHPIVCENFGLPYDVYIAHIDVRDAVTMPLHFSTYEKLSKLPPVDRDLALVVKKDVAVGDMLKALKSVSEYIERIELFDIYDGEQIEKGCKSVAFSMRLQPTETTFSDSEINAVVNTVIAEAERAFGAKLR